MRAFFFHKRLIDELATGRFMYEGRNLVFLGPPGVGNVKPKIDGSN
jgi:DNA replication protein DnaC